MKRIKIIIFPIIGVLVVGFFIFNYNQKFALNARSETSNVVKISSVKENPTIQAILKKYKTQQEFENFFKLADPNLDDKFIIADDTKGGDNGWVILSKNSTEGEQVRDQNGKIINSYKVGDSRGAWVKDIRQALSERDLKSQKQ